MTNPWLAAALGALLAPPFLFVSPAMAQGLTAEEAARRFAIFDVNGDGRISKDEYELNKVVAIFGSREHERAAAASGAPGRPAGAIDRQIAITRQTSRVKPEIFVTLDSNGDGVLTGAEIIASDLLRFENIDRNGDGFIDRAEFSALIDHLFR